MKTQKTQLFVVNDELANQSRAMAPSTMSAMTSYRILITAEYLSAHFSVFLLILSIRYKCHMPYFMQIFVNSVERLKVRFILRHPVPYLPVSHQETYFLPSVCHQFY